MSPIDDYLVGLERRLFVRRRARHAMLEEMRGHLLALEAERGAPFADVEAIALAFGAAPALARRVNAAVPWRQARLPWRLLLVSLPAMALIMLLCWPIQVLAVNLVGHGQSGTILGGAVFEACPLLMYLGGVAAGMLYGGRIGARPLHRWQATLLPCALPAFGAAMILLGWMSDFDLSLWRYLAFKLVWIGGCLALCVLMARCAAAASRSPLRARIGMLSVGVATVVLAAIVAPPRDASLQYGTPLGFLFVAMLAAWLGPWLASRMASPGLEVDTPAPVAGLA